MAMKFKDVVVDGILVAIMFLLLRWVWTQIGNAFGLFATVANFGLMGVTVGMVLALGLGIPLASNLRQRIKFLK